jgi:nucleotide-binding universal stress UspA family protein
MAESKKTAAKKPGPKYRSTGEPERRQSRRAKVLVPVDFSDCSRRAVDFAVQYVEKIPSELYLFHVFEPVRGNRFVGKDLLDKMETNLERMESMAVAELERMIADSETRKRLSNFQCRVGNGKPWEEILRMAANISADIIIMGTHGREGIERALVGSVAEKVVRRSPCTVVCVKPKDPYFVMP